MTWGQALESINYLAVVGGTLATLALGALWYSQKAFGSEWMKLVGLKKKDMENKDGMGVMMSASIVFYFIATLIVAALLELTQMTGAFNGALMGAIVGFVFGFGPLVVTYGYARRRFELSMIDGAYVVMALLLAGLIVGWWQ